MGLMKEVTSFIYGMAVICALGTGVYILNSALLRHLDFVQKHRPIDAKAASEYAKKGDMAFNKKKWQEAIGFYSEAIKLNLSNSEYYLSRAAAYLELGSFHLAKKDCNNSLTFYDENPKAYTLRGTVQEMLGYYKGACDDFTHALYLETHPHEKGRLFLQNIKSGKTKELLSSYELANKQFRQSLHGEVCQYESSPFLRMDALAAMHRGRTEEMLGRYKEASKNFKETLTLKYHQQKSSPFQRQETLTLKANQPRSSPFQRIQTLALRAHQPRSSPFQRQVDSRSDKYIPSSTDKGTFSLGW